MSPPILCIDKSANEWHDCKRLLGQHYKIETVTEESANLEAIREKMPDLVVGDVEIFKPEEFRLLRELRTDLQTRELPIVLLSTSDREEYCLAGLETGADDYLLEPFSERELLVRIKANLKKAEMRKESTGWQQTLSAMKDALRQSEEITKEQLAEIEWIYATAPVGLCFLDTELKFVRINQHLAEMNGLSVSEHIGLTLKEVIPDLSDRLAAIYEQVIESGKAILNNEIRGKTPARPDEERDWLASYYPLQGSDGRVLGVNVMVQEITERKQVEEMLRHQAQIIDRVHDSIVSTDLNGQIVSWNNGATQLFGYSLEEALGKHISLLYPESMHSVLAEQTIAPVLEQGEAEIELFAQHKSGKVIDIFLSLSLLRDREGTPVGVVGYSIDITKRKQAEKKVREQAALIDVATDAIFVRSLSHEILFWNRSAENLYGWQAAEVIGKKATELFCKEILSQIEEARESVIEQGHWQGELQQLAKNRKKIVVQSRWTLLRDETGQPKSILVVNTDITKKKQLEAQLMRAQRLESLGTLASGISHDFNNLLTPILGVAQLLPLKLSNLDEQTRQLLEIVENNSKRGADLASQILSFARGVEGKRVPIQIKYLLKEIERIVKSLFPKSIEVCIDIPKENLWTIVGDSTQIHQVLMNLCINARDAMPDGGNLDISARNFYADESYVKMNLDARTGPYVEISIEDTGCGIPEAIKERVFEPFFTTKAPGLGTGLGLFSVINIVNNQKGFMRLDSQIGEGTRFQIYLPAVYETAAQKSPNSDLLGGNGESILIVDDETNILETTKTILEKYNYEALTAKDAIEALSLYAQHKDRIRVVLMDMQMPVMDGLKAIPILQRIDPRVRIVATSGVVSNRKILEAYGSNIKSFLLKPYTIKQLLDTIQSV